jgi:hypothetical protein
MRLPEGRGVRIAIALFGIPRGSDVTMPVIAENIIGACRASGETRIFYHLYKQSRVTNARSGDDASISAAAYAPFERFQGELEPPDICLSRWHYDIVRRFGDHYRDDFQSVRNLLHQLHSLRRVTRVVEAWGPDVVVFVRPDLLYHQPLSGAAIASASRDALYCRIPDWQWWGGYNDRFAVCGRRAASAYGRRAELAIEFSLRTGRPLHAERLLRYALRRQRAAVRLTRMRASRVRMNGRIVDEDFSWSRTVGSVQRAFELNWLRARTDYLGEADELTDGAAAPPLAAFQIDATL